jgi:hypothetical protein
MSQEARPNQAKVLDSETPYPYHPISKFVLWASLVCVIVVIATAAFTGERATLNGRRQQQAEDQRAAIKAGVARWEADPGTGEPIFAYVSPATCKPTLKWSP